MTLAVTLAAATSASAQWTGEFTPIAAPGQSIFSPEAAVGPDGLTTVVWDGYAENPVRNLVEVAQLPTIGAPPGAKQSVTDINEHGMNQEIAADPYGNTFIVWPRTSGVSVTKMRRINSDGNMSPEQTLSQGSYSEAYHDVAADTNGNAAVAWQEQESSGDSAIKFSYVDSSLQASTPYTFASATSGEYVTDPHVKFDSAGNAVVTYFRWAAGSASVETVSFSPSTGASASRVIANDNSGDTVAVSSVDVSGDGDVMVGYDVNRVTFEWPFDYSSERISSNLVRLNAGSTVPLATNLEVTGYEPFAPQVKFYSDGSGVLGFRSLNGSRADPFIAPIDSHGAIGAAVPVSAGVGTIATQLLAVGGDDVATLVWTEYDGYFYKLFGRQVSKSGAITPARALSPTNHVSEVSLTAGADGLVAVAYLQYNANTIQVTNNVPAPVCSDASDATSGGAAAVFSLDCVSATNQTLSLASNAGHGNVQLSSSDMQATYTPEPGFEGIDQFTFKSTNAYGDSQTATFDVTVTQNSTPPIATPPAAEPPPALVISRLGLSRSLLPRLARARRALDVTFSISSAAKVDIVVRRRYGRVIRGRCGPSRRVPGQVRRCRRDRDVLAKSTGLLAAGRHNVSLAAHGIRNKLRPGSYLVSVTATTGAQSSLAMRELRVNWRRDR